MISSSISRPGESDGDFRSLFEVSSVGMAQAEISSRRLLRVNPAFCKLTGYSEAELLAMKVGDLNHPDDQQRDREALASILRGDVSEYRIEKRYIRKDGAVIWVHVSGCVLADCEGRPCRTNAVIQDITERKRSEQASRLLMELDEALSAVSNSAQMAAAAVERVGRFFQVPCCALLGFTSPTEPPIARAMWQHAESGTPAADGYLAKETISESMRQVLAAGLPLLVSDAESDSRAAQTPDQPGAFCSLLAMPFLSDGALKFAFILGRREPCQWLESDLDLVRQLTARVCPRLERAVALEAQRRSEELLHFHIQHSPLAVVELDHNFRVTRWVGEAERMFGWTAAETLGRFIDDLNIIHEADVPIVEGVKARLTDGATRHVTSANRNVTKDGRIIHCVWRNSVVRDAAGKMSSFFSLVEDMTERKAAEQALAASEERLRRSQDAARFGTWDWNLRANILSWSDGIFRLLGVEPWSFEPSIERWMAFVLPEDTAPAMAAAQNAIARAGEFDFEFRIRRADGQVRWLSSVGRVEVDADGTPARLLGVNTDITDRKAQEEALQRREAQLRVLTDTVPALISYIDAGLRYRFVNRAYEVWFGRARDQVIGKTMAEVLGEPAFERLRPHVDRVLRGDRVHFETSAPYQNGAARFIDGHYIPDIGQSGRVLGFYVFVMDLTARKEAEMALLARTAELESLLTSAPIGVAFFDRGHRYLRINEALAEINGIAARDHIGRAVEDLLPITGAAITPVIDRVFATGEAINNLEVKGETPREPGVTRHWLTGFYPVKDAQSAVSAVGVWVAEITERKRSEDRLRESEERFRSMADSLSLSVWVHDADGHQEFINRASREFFGLEQERMTGEQWRALLHPQDARDYLGQFLACVRDRRPFHAEARARNAAGEWVSIESWGSPRFSGSGEFVGFIVASADITRRKEIEQALARAKESAEAASRAKDEFLATLSHELRTPLNPALLLASEMEQDPSLSDEVREDFRMIRKHVELEARLIDDLLDLTRITRGKVHLEKHVVDLHALLRQTVEIVRSEIVSKRLTVTLDFAEPAASVWGDAVRLQQVFWNVLKNAVKFTPDGGSISIRALRSGGRTLITEVTDTGVGIEPDDLSRIFDTFSQGRHETAANFGGLGLGLAISRLLVELHDGRITAESEGRGRGCTLRIELPLADASLLAEPETTAPLLPGSDPAAGTDGRPPRILVVEDHQPTRETLTRLLRRRNFEVFPAESVDAARQIADSTPVDFVISDLGLPDGDGHSLMAELRARHGLSGIALSGYGMQEDVIRSINTGFQAHLTKPVDMQALERAIAALRSLKS